MGEAGQVEFMFGIQLGRPAGVVRAEHAIGADHFAIRADHHQVIAQLVVLVAVDAQLGRGQLRAHFFAKNAVAQFLRLAQFVGVGGQAHAQAGRARGAGKSFLQHGFLPIMVVRQCASRR